MRLKVERESISDYVQESENLAKLHMKIKDCDDVLANMQVDWFIPSEKR